MLSPCRIPPNSNKRKQKISNCEHDLKRPQMTSSDPVVKPVKSKIEKKGGENFELNDEYLDEIFHNNNL